MTNYDVRSFYFFKDVQAEHLSSIRAWLIGKASMRNILGLMILGTEGLNTTLASSDSEELNLFIEEVAEFFSMNEVVTKNSQSHRAPFRRFVVKIREEIVTLGKPEFLPGQKKQHLSPEQWNQMLETEDVVIVDTRNDYEYEIGTFKNAIDLKIKEFTEFPEKINNIDTDKDKPHLIFCTGGIRCEKAIYEMENQGYKNVYQLDGGILNYMEQYPEGHFEGECFVFDSRVALNKDLEPSQVHSLCPQCGEVGSLEITCLKCDEPAKICKKCKDIGETKAEYLTCSKNCRNHYKRNPDKKGPQQKQFYHTPS